MAARPATDHTAPGVLVTRPAGEASDGLCRAIVAAGFRAHSQPLLELHALPELSASQRCIAQRLDQYQHVIFISANAVRFGLAWLEHYWPRWPAGVRCYAIGDATARLLATLGIAADTPGTAMNSEGLLALDALQQVRDSRVLIVKGEGGRDTLALELSRRGAQVDGLACYRRRCPALAAGELARKVAQWRIDVIMVSSGEGLANLLKLLSPPETSKFMQLCLIVPSERVAVLARDAGFIEVVSAENASDAAMLRALESWHTCAGDCE